MQAPSLLTFDGWSALIKSYPWNSWFRPWDKVRESKHVSEKHIMSKLFREVYAFRSETSEKFWSEILFKFQWHTKKFSQEFDSSKGLSSMSPLKLMCNLQRHTWQIYFANRDKCKTWRLKIQITDLQNVITV